MPNWNQVLNEVNTAGSTYDIIRRRYLAQLREKTGRNVIVYYSGWLQKKDVQGVEINDEDKNGFMTVIHQLDRSLGLDLVLHTPGGETSATESIVHYLRSMFGTNMRAIVPQLAMSGGTMIACACREIILIRPHEVVTRHSALGCAGSIS
jgi:ClpP class serine protease